MLIYEVDCETLEEFELTFSHMTNTIQSVMINAFNKYGMTDFNQHWIIGWSKDPIIKKEYEFDTKYIYNTNIELKFKNG
jgi:hypothetical protein